MDPAGVTSSIMTSVKLVQLCANAEEILDILHSKVSRFRHELLAIRRECTTLRPAVETIQAWAESAEGSRREEQCVYLDDALKDFSPSLQLLVEDVEKVLNSNDDSSPNATGKFRFPWGEERINYYLTEAQWQSQHVHFLLSTLDL
jgi:hypothetical protein